MGEFNSDYPKISIITVCFNSAATVRDTLESVAEQDYPNIEYLVIDGGSTDSTSGIIEEYRDRIDYVVSEKDDGIYDAMNKGIRASAGDFVGILNSDDVFSGTDSVTKIASAIRHNKGVDAVYGDLVYVDRANLDKTVRLYSSKFFRPWKMRFGFMLPHPTFYARRELFDRLGLYRTDYRVAADFELLSRFLCKGVKVIRIEDILVKMRDGGISSTGFWWRVHQNLEIVKACRGNGIYTNILLVSLKVPFKIASYFLARNT
ncbi:glycosyltransferase family 2 protein [Marinobacter sp. 1_MG-2023]|uniref:glycosyltransferase family 2 protein n=1 Tax=Marinobacter sp. 1_MG-2023 TaxID=3062627 RepID=UPI0026E17D8C|nr:glycosyltransferase family 2 protein [Marinobacter sp. 1_MG-2023]MDO6823307.1 glycosyltransferase family 2 protein [Marinobacter sp. 1_MG-2023]